MIDLLAEGYDPLMRLRDTVATSAMVCHAARMTIDLDQAIAILYASQINCGHQTFLDGGITIWLGDDVNGRTAETTLPPQSLGSAGAWLVEAARRIYPDKFP